MHIIAKTLILPSLVIFCLLGSWQGISGYDNTIDDTCRLQAEAPITPNNTFIQETAVITDSVYSHSVSARSVTGTVQDTTGEAAVPEWPAGLMTSPSPATGVPVIVAVLDTGIDKNHEDLDGTVTAEINFTESPTVADIHGHGTHIAGIIAAVNDNNLGINGMAPESRLLNIKVADDNGACRMSSLVKGIYWAVEAGASVINISIEMTGPSPELEAAIDHAWENGAIIIAAAGNDGNSLPVYPANYENCISVTALRENGELAPLANYGDWVDTAAPGFNIYSTLPGDEYGYKHGTSFAAAYVSGLAARLLPLVEDSNGNGRVNDEIRQAIIAFYSYNAMCATDDIYMNTSDILPGTLADNQ